MHYLENKKEIDDIRQKYNMEPLDVIKESGLINNTFCELIIVSYSRALNFLFKVNLSESKQ